MRRASCFFSAALTIVTGAIRDRLVRARRTRRGVPLPPSWRPRVALARRSSSFDVNVTCHCDVGAAEKARDLFERPLRRREPDALQTARDCRIAECFEPFERQRQVRAALAGNERVDLVDDDRVDRASAARARST